MNRTEKAEKIFDLQLDYMILRLQTGLAEGSLEKGELKTIQEFLASQGVSCVAKKNAKVTRLADKMPVKLAVNEYKKNN